MRGKIKIKKRKKKERKNKIRNLRLGFRSQPFLLVLCRLGVIVEKRLNIGKCGSERKRAWKQ